MKFPWMILKGITKSTLGQNNILLNSNYTKLMNDLIFNNNPVNYGIVPEIFDRDQDAFLNIMKYLDNVVPTILDEHQGFDGKIGTVEGDKTLFSIAEANDTGHSTFSVGFLKHRDANEVVTSNRLLIHALVGFAAGGGALMPPSLVASIIQNGREIKSVPIDYMDRFYPAQQSYTGSIVKTNKNLTGEVGLLGNNAIYFKNHINQSIDNGAHFQILRPITLIPHALDGQGLWVAFTHPSLPMDTIGYSFIGHGKHQFKIFDEVNNAFGSEFWHMSFRAGNTSSQKFNEYFSILKSEAYRLGTSERYSDLLTQDLYKIDPTFAHHIAIASMFDSHLGMLPRQVRGYFGANTCEIIGNGQNIIESEECESKEVEFEKVTNEYNKGNLKTIQDFLDLYSNSFSVNKPLGIYDNNLEVYEGSIFDSALSLASPSYDFSVSSLMGEAGNPLDRFMFDVIKPHVGTILDGINEYTGDYVKEQVQNFVEIADPFKELNSVDKLADQIISDNEFLSGLKLKIELSVSLDYQEKINEILVAIDSFKDFEAVSFDEYPFDKCIVENIFTMSTESTHEQYSLLHDSVVSVLYDSKVKYLSSPESFSEYQKNISSEKIEYDSYDINTVEGDIEIENRKIALLNDQIDTIYASILVDGSNYESLDKERQELDREIEERINTKNKNEEFIENKILIDRENNLSVSDLEKQSKSSKNKVEEKKKELFEI